MDEGECRELEQLLRELADLDDAKHDSPPSSHDPLEGVKASLEADSLSLVTRQVGIRSDGSFAIAYLPVDFWPPGGGQ